MAGAAVSRAVTATASAAEVARAAALPLGLRHVRLAGFCCSDLQYRAYSKDNVESQCTDLSSAMGNDDATQSKGAALQH